MIFPIHQWHFDRTPHAIGQKLEPRARVKLIRQRLFDQPAAKPLFAVSELFRTESSLSRQSSAK
jgi:hypothetical protein